MSSYVLNKYSDLSPPFYSTVDDVNMERIPTRSHQDPSLVTGFSEDFLERNVVERYWAGEPKQVGGENAKY